MYKWLVTYSDGRTIKQYPDETSEEVLFGSIPDDNISLIMWYNEEENRQIAVNIDNGEFYLNGAVVRPRAASDKRKFKPHLWFRNRVKYRSEEGESPKDIAYVLGWETNLGKKAHKLFVVIEQDHTTTFERYIDNVVQEARLVI